MAYDDSEALQPDSTYSLGNYSFDLNVSYIHEPDEDLVAISAICNGPDGRRESAPIYVPNGSTIESWYVEANETEASVYVNITNDFEPLDTDPIPQPITPGGRSLLMIRRKGAANQEDYAVDFSGAACLNFADQGGASYGYFFASSNPEDVGARNWIRTYHSDGSTESGTDYTSLRNEFTYAGKTVYWWKGTYGAPTYHLDGSGDYPFEYYYTAGENVAWMMVYGSAETEEDEKLVARFAIDLSEADGGPDGDWDEPGSDGPFSDQIYVEVTGASAGAHSASNIPQEAPEQLTYGSGGIGGNGGGGGAGASTVIIYDFVSHRTSIDGPAENAIIREPGTGGPGGKGGKGGDGCILIFY